MNKMTVIQLLNKIANGINPKKIEYLGDIYEFDCYEGEWGYVNKEYRKYKWFAKEIDCDLPEHLNEEVEIIEEDKKIEKLEQRTDTGLIGTDSVDMIEHTNRINRQAGYLSEIVSKINEIIDYINKGDK